jgi:hypothetical protein
MDIPVNRNVHTGVTLDSRDIWSEGSETSEPSFCQYPRNNPMISQIIERHLLPRQFNFPACVRHCAAERLKPLRKEPAPSNDLILFL